MDDDGAAPTFGDELRRLRTCAGLSTRQLAERSHHSKTLINQWETGRKIPVMEDAAQLDEMLDGRGVLRDLQAAATARDPHDDAGDESERLTRRLAAARSGELVTLLDCSAAGLAVRYLTTPGAALMDEIMSARREAARVLHSRRLQNHHQLRYVTADIGYLSGILAYAALDDGHPRAALKHADAAWEAAEIVGSDQLKAWVRGTQSLILRFMQRYPQALERAEDGLRYATTGTGRARLLAGVGQCHANMSDRGAVRRALMLAEKSFDDQRGVDEMAGVFTFSRAKLMYYSGSSLIWLDGGEDAMRARDQAHQAIALWEQGGPDRSVADEALAHVYAATGSLQLHELEAAAADLEPILSLPSERRISWITKRMDRIVGMLGRPPYDTDPQARDLREQIKAYA